MYMDSVVFFSLVTVLGIVVMMVFGFRYMFQHIKKDAVDHQKTEEQENKNTVI